MKFKLVVLVALILILMSFSVNTISEAPGGGDPPAGTCPCYYVGEVFSEGGWYQSGYYYFVTYTYIGNCEIRQDWYRNGDWFQQLFNDGGCTCACAVPMEPSER